MSGIRTTISTALSYGAKVIGLGLVALIWVILWGSMGYKGATSGELTQAMLGGFLAAIPVLIAAYRLYEWSNLDIGGPTFP